MPINDNVKLGANVRIFHPNLVNIYGCTIGDETMIGPFVEIQGGVTIGRRCKIQSHSFICEGIHIADFVFVGHGVMFINDMFPRSTNANGELKRASDWTMVETHIGEGAAIGSNATILGGVKLGKYCLVGAGAVVTKDVPDYAIVVGNPAKIVGDVRERAGQDVPTE
jgi:UDP-2-acetamido-3-amino-2,3-dideoxy-glucuronate N-acetyltransferase